MAFTKTGEANIKTIEVIANDYIESLERGDIPWLRPWTFDPGVFTGNGVTNHEYSFLNRMLVSRPGKYYTAKQLVAKKAEMVKECPKHLLGKTLHGRDGDVEVTQEYWESLPDFSAYKFQRSKFSLLRNRVTFTEKKVYETGKLDEDGNPETREYRYLKYYYVVWAGYTSLYEGEPKPLPKAPRIKGCDALIQYYIKREGINLLEERGSEAFYRPSDDSIHLPAMEQFKIMEEFYSTAFHEMTHSTGVKKRLGRDMGGAFGSKSYAREELVAEIGASFLTNFFGIRIDSVERNNTAYIQSWIKKLQKDPSLIVKAASGAEKAMKFILNGYAEPEDLAPKKPAKQAKKPKGKTKGGKKVPKKEAPKKYLTNGDLLAKMANVVKKNVKSFKEDFTKYDVEYIIKVVMEKQYAKYLWAVKETGTHMLRADDEELRQAIEDTGLVLKWYELDFSPDGWTMKQKRGAR